MLAKASLRFVTFHLESRGIDVKRSSHKNAHIFKLLCRLCVLSCSVVSKFLQSYGACRLSRLLGPWNYPGKNIEEGSHALLQWIFLTQGSNLGLPHCRWILYHLSHQGSPRINFYNERAHLLDTTFLAVPAN